MAKIYTYVVITVGLLLLYSLSGLQTNTAWVLGQLGLGIENIGEFNQNAFWVAMGAALLLMVGTAGIRIGVIGAQSPSIFASAGFAIPLAVMVGDLMAIVQQSTASGVTWVSYITFLIMTPLMVGYGIALIEWARGTD